MKISIAIPDHLGRQFKKTVPAGQRSAVVTGLLKRKLRATQADLEQVCDRVNRFSRLNHEMAQWERFDDSDA
ncbi:MAG: hypothetical protein ACYDH9_25450 [Limisphaerales bacterium]